MGQHFTDMPNTVIRIKDYPQNVISGNYHNIGFRGMHNDMVKAPMMKKVFKDIGDVFKNSKVKPFGYCDAIISTSLALNVETIYYLNKYTYYYDNRSKKEEKRSNDKVDKDNKNLLMDLNAKLVYLRVCLRFTDSDEALNKILDRFKSEYEKNNFSKINRYFKEDMIIFCDALEKRLSETEYFKVKRMESKVDLVKEKCDSIKKAEVTVIYDNGVN